MKKLTNSKSENANEIQNKVGEITKEIKDIEASNYVINNNLTVD